MTSKTNIDDDYSYLFDADGGSKALKDYDRKLKKQKCTLEIISVADYKETDPEILALFG